MWRLFISLYAVIVIFSLSIDFLTYQYVLVFHRDLIVEDLSRDFNSWSGALDRFTQGSTLEELKEVFESNNEGSNLPLEVLTSAELVQRYPQAVSRFNAHNMFFLDIDDYEFLYRMKDQRAVLKIGPIDTIPALDNLTDRIDYIVWFLLAVVLLLWQINLWRKLVGLERKVIEFGDGNLAARADTKPGVRVGKLNTAFNSMAANIGQLLLQNKQLIRAVSHELRAPISRLRCQVDLLDASNERSANAAYLDDMSDDIQELENLVSEILNYSRLEAADTIGSELVERHLQPVLADLLSTMAREFSRDIPLHCNAEITARINKVLFRRAVGNLIRNAARYCADVVAVSVAVDNGGVVLIQIDDDGPGIPAAERERIFEPFARLDHSRTRDSGGYGVGLAIVRQIARLHGGTIDVATAPLGGARFTLRLPGCAVQPRSP